jgi:hypothetical protein
MFKIVKNNFYKKLNNHNNKKIDLDTVKIHHAFLIRSVRQLSRYGLCIMVLPTYFLDNLENNISHHRKKVSDIAKLELAFRLPNNVFTNAKVTTDIVVFKRHNDWVNTTKIEIDNGYQDYLSNYYINHPSHILGTLENYEVKVKNENRTRHGLKVTGTLENAIKRLKELI